MSSSEGSDIATSSLSETSSTRGWDMVAVMWLCGGGCEVLGRGVVWFVGEERGGKLHRSLEEVNIGWGAWVALRCGLC
jgi:hypothetical protein